MSYIIRFDHPMRNLGHYDWFDRSYRSLHDWDDPDLKLEQVDREYEQRFNVRLLYESDSEAPLVGVEFPSEADAALFLLKWS